MLGLISRQVLPVRLTSFSCPCFSQWKSVNLGVQRSIGLIPRQKQLLSRALSLSALYNLPRFNFLYDHLPKVHQLFKKLVITHHSFPSLTQHPRLVLFSVDLLTCNKQSSLKRVRQDTGKPDLSRLVCYHLKHRLLQTVIYVCTDASSDQTSLSGLGVSSRRHCRIVKTAYSTGGFALPQRYWS